MRMFFIIVGAICYLLMSAGYFNWAFNDFSNTAHVLWEWLLFISFVVVTWLFCTWAILFCISDI